MRGSHRRLLLMAAASILILSPSASGEALAEEGAVPATREREALFAKGTQKLSIQVGYGEGVGLFSSVGKDSADVRTIAVVPSWGAAISEIKGEEAWYRGSWEALLEGILTIQESPEDGLGGGAALNFRYNFLSDQRVVPFLGLGVGLAGIDFDLDSASDGFNFILQAGVGAHWFATDRVAPTFEARWHHYSNAQILKNNAGINSALFLIGTTIFLD